MDTNTSETVTNAGQRRTFTQEFKEAAVRLVSQEGYSVKAAAKAVGVGEQSRRQWQVKLSLKPPICGDDATVEQLSVESRRLQRLLRQTELEREILKKATAYFAKEL